MAGREGAEVVLRLDGITKRFGPLVANDAISFDLKKGEVIALLGDNGELCVCDLASVLEMTPAAVSQHLSRLRSGRLVQSRRDGMTIYYRLTEGAGGLPRVTVSELETLAGK